MNTLQTMEAEVMIFERPVSSEHVSSYGIVLRWSSNKRWLTNQFLPAMKPRPCELNGRSALGEPVCSGPYAPAITRESQTPLTHWRGGMAATGQGVSSAGTGTTIEASGHCRALCDRLNEHFNLTLVSPGRTDRLLTYRLRPTVLTSILRADAADRHACGELRPQQGGIRTLRNFIWTRKALIEKQTAKGRKLAYTVLKCTNKNSKWSNDVELCKLLKNCQTFVLILSKARIGG